MLVYVAILLALAPIVAVLMFGRVARLAVQRARPEDLPRILEICGQLLRRPSVELPNADAPQETEQSGRP